jgi:hypothetical protein
VIWRVSAVPTKVRDMIKVEPLSPAESAELGAEIRQRLMSLLDKVEGKIGQPAVALAEKEGVLMTHPKLLEEIRTQPDGEVLEAALGMCFPTPDMARKLAQTWQFNVKRFAGKPNTVAVLRDKSAVLTTCIMYSLSASQEAYAKIPNFAVKPDYEQETKVRLEEAACWLRVVSEIAFNALGDDRYLFIDYFSEDLAHSLALEGASPNVICGVMSARSASYAKYKEWVPREGQDAEGTLFWEAAKNSGKITGADRYPLFLLYFGMFFLQRYKKAMIFELLRG